MPTLHPEGFRFNGRLYKTVEEFRAAMIEAANRRPKLHPEGRQVEYDPKAVKAFEDEVRENQGRET